MTATARESEKPALAPSGDLVREANPSAGVLAGRVLAGIVLYPRTVWRNHEILGNFFGRELRARFRGTVLGFAWPFVLPLVLFLVYYFVFAELLGAKFARSGLDNEQQKKFFTVYLFVGVIAWSGFAESVIRCSNVILENSNLIKKISFPSEILPLNIVLASVTIQAVALVAYVVLVPFLGWNPIGWRLLALPAVFAAQVVFSLGLGLFFAAANVFLRDTGQILGIAMTFWQFLTPVFWQRDLIPGMEKYLWVMTWNPMYYLLEAYRKVLVNPGAPEYIERDAAAGFPQYEWPFADSLVVVLSGLGLFVIGTAVFLLSKPKFADEL